MSATLSGVLTTDGTPLGGRTVTFELGSGASAQKLQRHHQLVGCRLCVIAMFNQTTSPVPVTDSFAGDAYSRPRHHLGKR